MKKVFLTLAFVATLSLTSCKQVNKEESTTVDTTLVDTTTVDTSDVDTTTVDTTQVK